MCQSDQLCVYLYFYFFKHAGLYYTCYLTITSCPSLLYYVVYSCVAASLNLTSTSSSQGCAY